MTHLGTTYIVSQAVRAWQPWPVTEWPIRHILLGALLPDATRFTIILVDILDWPAIPTFTYFIPFHSLLIVSLMAGALALVLPVAAADSRRAFTMIMAGAVGHFILDDLDGLIGCGSTTFYPFYFKRILPGWHSEGHWATILLLVSAMAIGLALGQRHSWPRLRLGGTRSRWLGATFLLGLALALPLLWQRWLIEANAYSLGLVINPAAFEGQAVELCYSQVIATDPLTVEEFDRPFVVATSQAFNGGEWLSLRGTIHKGVIQPSLLLQQRGFADLIVSLVAAGSFLILLVDWDSLLKYLKSNFREVIR